METNKELNQEFKDEVNAIFTALFKEIGSNRQQLATKVLNQHKEIYKELNKDKVGEERKKEILVDISKIVKMAHQQLPHLKMNPPRPASPPGVKAAPQLAKVPAPAKAQANKPVKVAPKAKPVASKTKPATSKTKKTTSSKKKK